MKRGVVAPVLDDEPDRPLGRGIDGLNAPDAGGLGVGPELDGRWAQVDQAVPIRSQPESVGITVEPRLGPEIGGLDATVVIFPG